MGDCGHPSSAQGRDPESGRDLRRLRELCAVQEHDAEAVAELIREYQRRARRLRAAKRTGEANRWGRRAFALEGLLRHGPDPARMVAETELPEGYHGKILLAALNGGGFDAVVCLRSGDDWHREILRNTRAELSDLGFSETEVHALGGAYARFEPADRIVIWGTSDEFGCCDKQLAARMIARAHPQRTVVIED